MHGSSVYLAVYGVLELEESHLHVRYGRRNKRNQNRQFCLQLLCVLDAGNWRIAGL